MAKNVSTNNDVRNILASFCVLGIDRNDKQLQDASITDLSDEISTMNQFTFKRVISKN